MPSHAKKETAMPSVTGSVYTEPTNKKRVVSPSISRSTYTEPTKVMESAKEYFGEIRKTALHAALRNAAMDSPLYVSRQGSLAFVLDLIKKGADLTAIDEKGYSILHYANVYKTLRDT